MNPNEQWLDIDMMLQSLDTEEKILSSQDDQSFVPEVQQIEEARDMEDFPEAPQKKKTLKIGKNARLFLSLGSTLGVIFLALWVLSIQYPEETKKISSGITDTFSNIGKTVSNNRKTQEIISLDGEEDGAIQGNWFDGNYTTWSPLADALDQADSSKSWNKADDLFAELWGDNTIDFTNQNSTSWWTTSMSWSLVESWSSDESWALGWKTQEPDSSYVPNYNLPDIDLPDFSEFIDDIGQLMRKAKSARDNYLGNKQEDSAKLWVVYKNMVTILKDTTQKKKTTRENYDRYQTMKAMYEAVMR